MTTPSHSVSNVDPLYLLRSFVGTPTAGPDFGDILATRETAIPWLRAVGLMPADGVLTGSELGALLRLRDALREALAAHASGSTDPEVAARLTKGLADGRLVVTIDPASGSVKLATAARSVYPSIVAAIAVAIAEADAADGWLKLV